MEKPEFKLSRVLAGHSLDVRAIASFADGSIVSVSRDKTARVWKPTGDDNYTPTAALTGHKNYVSSVCVLNPCTTHPSGLILTGGNDHMICVYTPGEAAPHRTIEAHQNTVCKLRAGREEGTFLSSSWDMTAKLWDAGDLETPRVTLTGHTAAVWCVAELTNGLLATGSADKTITVWTKHGRVKHKLKGHTDCVRDLIPINQDEILSCANDATIRHWNSKSGSCLGTYCGHSNYIYGIAAVPDGTTVFSCGEDRTMIIWSMAEPQQTVRFPMQSVWCLDLLPNGDVVVGGSDGLVRIFTAKPERYADQEQLALYEKEVSQSQINAAEELGGLKIKDLPDASALEQPGQKDGQIKMVNESDGVNAYSWSQSEQAWMKIGRVTGAAGGSPETSGKLLHNGIEYDYVFSIDIQDGVPPLKLPYNKGQDPWHVAQKFLHDNDLSQMFLEQVANFIIKNTENAPIVQGAGSEHHDPFTGGNRYVPSSGSGIIPVESVSSRSSSDTSTSTSYIPHTTYLKLEHANLAAISDKLREMNSRQAGAARVPDEQLETVVKLVGGQVPEQLRSQAIRTLRGLLDWPKGMLFPVLDIARLAVLRKDVNDELCTDDLFAAVRVHLTAGAESVNQMLAFRLLANMFCHQRGEALCLSHKDEIQQALLQLGSLGPKGNQIAISTYILNTVIALNLRGDAPSKSDFLNAIITILPKINEAEAVFRTLVALGTILSATANVQERNQLSAKVRSSEIMLNQLRSISESTITTASSSKVANCADQIISYLT